MKIFVVDDNKSFREGIKLYLEGHLGHQVIGEASDGKFFLENIGYNADIVLMDINMPSLNGIETAIYCTKIKRQIKIIAVSQYKELADLQTLIFAGFKGFVSKENLYRDLENALISVAAGEVFFPDEIDIGIVNDLQHKE